MQSLSLAANTGRTRVVQYANIYQMCSIRCKHRSFQNTLDVVYDGLLVQDTRWNEPEVKKKLFRDS